MTVAEPKGPVYGKKTILLVDPDDPSYLFVRLVLDDYNVELIHARTGMAAIEMLRERAGIEGILTEIRLQDLDGFEMLKEARKIVPGIPVVALTATVLYDIDQKCRMAGFNEFIPKPVNVTNFITKMKNLGLTGPMKEHPGQ